MKFADRFDWQLFLILICFISVSCIALYSAQQSPQYNENFLFRQLFWFAIGGALIGAMLYFNSDDYNQFSIYLYIAGLLLLAGLIVAPASIAPIIKGQKSWYVLPGIGSIQPAEIMKVFTILMLGRTIANHNKKARKQFRLKYDFALLGKLTFITALPLFLIMQQPDLGTALVFIAILGGMLIVSGIRWRIILSLFISVGTVAISTIWLVINKPNLLFNILGVKEYQLGRIYSWLQPFEYQDTSGYHLIRVMRAIGSGQLYGKGFGDREVYIPESHTDFIFSIISEEFGFVGSSLVILLFFSLIFRLTLLAHSVTSDFSTYILVGIISMISFHVLQNIGMSIQLLPITGIPLPFISYGGSALIGNLMALGLAFSISYHHKSYMF